MLLCAITDRQRLRSAGSTAAEGEVACRRHLRALLRGWAEGGVDYVQLREKDLSPEALLALAGELLAGPARPQAKILLNLPAASLSAFEEAALEDGLAALLALCDGIHLPNRPAAEDVQLVRQVFRRHGRECVVSMSCHRVEEIRIARRVQADMVFFAPVFEKYAPGGPSRNPGQGLTALGHACAAAEGMPVFALGGVSVDNASDCFRAGAAGVAGIRLFQEGDWRQLRPSSARGNHI
jgi:thiamine-phosphate pyrophosphorylase